MGESVGIIYNPISGRGKSRLLAGRLKDRLEAEGFSVVLQQSSRDQQTLNISKFLGPLTALVVVGGDGTLQSLLPVLVESQTPVYMLPAGNESLFARELSMSRSADDIISAIRAGDCSRHYIAQINEGCFFAMVSIGLDAEVVQRISQERSGPIGHIGYLLPLLLAAWRHHAPKINLFVDGKQVIEGESGFLIVANNKQYALGLNFVPEADYSQTGLCARFFPYSGLVDLFGLYLKGLRNRLIETSLSYYHQGKEIEFDVVDGGYPLQADGEYAGTTPARISSSGAYITVLMPKPARPTPAPKKT